MGTIEAPRHRHALLEKAAHLAEVLGVTQLDKYPGCWEHAVDDKLWLAFNGHDIDTPCTRGIKVPPRAVYFEARGWPIGLVEAEGFTVLEDSEDWIAARLDAAIERARGPA